MVTPYYQDDRVTLYHGDYRTVLGSLDTPMLDAIVTDPPYAETSLDWDQWPDSRPLARLVLTVLDRVLTAALNQFDRRRTTEWMPAWPDAMVVTFPDGER